MARNSNVPSPLSTNPQGPLDYLPSPLALTALIPFLNQNITNRSSQHHTHPSFVPMATEAKVEPKTEASKPAETKEVAVEENTEPSLKYKTLVLKVSVHCEGCKRKVKKILNNIEDVYTSDIDLRQQKVTVLGNVEAETLIKKLVKMGKHAELWPDQKAEQKKKKKKSKGKNKEKEKDKNSDNESSEEGSEKEKETVKFEVPKVQDPPKASEKGGGATSKAAVDCRGGNICNVSENGGVTVNAGVQGKEVMPEVKQPVILPVGNQPPPVADKTGGGENQGGSEKIGGGGGGGGSGGKKKKKKGHNGNIGIADGGEHSGDAPAGTGWPSQGDCHVEGQTRVVYPTNPSPPRYHGHQYPAAPRYYAPPPVYTVNYNTAHPSTSSSASSHYAPQYSYSYMHPGPTIEPPPTYLDSYPSSQSSDSFEIFSDENPNACSIM